MTSHHVVIRENMQIGDGFSSGCWVCDRGETVIGTMSRQDQWLKLVSFQK